MGDSPPADGLSPVTAACPRCLPMLPTQPLWLDDQGRCPACGQLWPQLLVRGRAIPVLVPDAHHGQWMADQVAELLQNPALLHSWADGEDPTLAALANGLLTYAQAHYGRWAAVELPHPDLSWLREWLPGDLPQGNVLVLGSGPGGELAALAGEPALQGRQLLLADSNLAAIAWGQWLAEDGAVALPWRSSATRVAWTEVALPPAEQQQLAAAQWVCADALHPPWPAGRAALVISLALLDTVSDPIALVQQVEALLAPGGAWLLASPWCWQNRVTPQGRQLERFVDGEEMAAGLVELMTGRVIPGLGSALRLERHASDVPWLLQMHPRFLANYSLQVMLLRRT